MKQMVNTTRILVCYMSPEGLPVVWARGYHWQENKTRHLALKRFDDYLEKHPDVDRKRYKETVTFIENPDDQGKSSRKRRG